MNGIFLIDKPVGMTSFDVIAKLRRILGIKKMGHTGTLDPNATGLMMILVGQSTKYLPFIDRLNKTYEAQMELGYKTHTGDVWGEVIATQERIDFSEEQLQRVLSTFLGESTQIPPMVSALSVNGKRLYEYAREHIEIERKPRIIHIDAISGIKVNDKIHFRVTCSSGTYVRTLCEDIALKLNNLGTMSALRRVQIDQFSVDDALKIEEVDPATIPWMDPLSLIHLPQVEVEEPNFIYQGKGLLHRKESDQILITYQKKILAVYAWNEIKQMYTCVRGLF